MYGVKEESPWQSLVGATLIQVCIGEHDIQLHFDRSISILIMSAITIGKGDVCEDYRKAATPLCQFLGSTLVEVRPKGGHCLTLTFEQGLLELLDDDEAHESFVVTSGDSRIVV